MPVFFERGNTTGGILTGDWKYIASGEEGFDACPPYDTDPSSYPGELEELYNVREDPAELDNRAEMEPEIRADLRVQVCDWLLSVDRPDTENPLVQMCESER